MNFIIYKIIWPTSNDECHIRAQNKLIKHLLVKSYYTWSDEIPLYSLKVLEFVIWGWLLLPP